MILSHTLSAPTLLREDWILGEKASINELVVVFFRYWVAASFPPVRIAVASEKERFFTAFTKIGLASITASSAALFRSFTPSSERLPNPILLRVLSTFWSGSGKRILAKELP